MDKLFEEWESVLEAEGLGVIEVDDHWHGVGFKYIKGKHKRLDAMLNNVEPSGMMTVSPPTAVAVETRYSDAESEQSDFDDGLWDDDEIADNAWDALILSLTASPKDSELADRARGAVFGLDDFGRPRSGKVYRKKGETDEQYAERVAERLSIATDSDGPAYTPWRPPTPQHAERDAKSGPLNIVDRPKRDYGNRPDDIKMSPVVDTLGYLQVVVLTSYRSRNVVVATLTSPAENERPRRSQPIQTLQKPC